MMGQANSMNLIQLDNSNTKCPFHSLSLSIVKIFFESPIFSK